MSKIKKLSISTLLIFSLLLGFCTFNVSSATQEIVVKTFSISETGSVEVYGYIKNVPTTESHQITILLIKGSESDLSKITSSNANDVIAYIDQKEAGNNCSFLFKFQLNEKFLTTENLTSDFTLTINSDTQAEAYHETINISNLEFSLRTISNNDVIYGLDAYSLLSSGLTAKNVADSIVYGGNQIYYKLGNVWYNLLDEKATDSSYLVAKNAVSDTIMENLILRYYYKGQYKLNFVK